MTLPKVVRTLEGVKNKVLGLRICDENLRSCDEFQWPESGFIEAPDWDPKPECGNGLHFFLWGEGDGALANWSEKAKWLVVEVAEDQIVTLHGESKVKNCIVVFCGTREGATAYLLANGALGKSVIGATLTGGYRATLTGGYGATLTGGDHATLMGGNHATLTGGDRAILTGGDYATLTGGYGATLKGGYGATLKGGYGAILTGGYGATLTGGDRAILTGGNRATLTGGNHALLTGGYGATLAGGDYATLTGGDNATLTGGDRATLTGGDGATLTGGENSLLMFSFWDGKRKRIVVGYVGENGSVAGKPYRLVDGKITEVS